MARDQRHPAGEEHANWKGDQVGYAALHRWLYRHLERIGHCSECGAESPVKGRTVMTEWANVSGHYYRDLTDYVELCISCHRRRDNRGLIHGTSTGYSYYRCCCVDCRAAHARRRRDYVRRKREGAINHRA